MYLGIVLKVNFFGGVFYVKGIVFEKVYVFNVFYFWLRVFVWSILIIVE